MAAHWHYQESSSGFESNYKSIESEEDTRNPTTNKKIHGTPVQFRRSNPYMSAHEPDTHPQYSNTRSHSISEQLYLQPHSGTYSKRRSCNACEPDESSRLRHSRDALRGCALWGRSCECAELRCSSSGKSGQ